MGAALPLLADTGRSRQIVGGLRDDGSAMPGKGSHSRPRRPRPLIDHLRRTHRTFASVRRIAPQRQGAGKLSVALQAASVAAVRDRVIASDPSDGIALPRVRRPEAAMTLPTTAQVSALLGKAPDAWGAFIVVSAFAGLRLGEAAALQVGDIDFLRRTLTVARQVHRAAGGQVEIRAPKSGSERTVYLADGLVEILSAHVAAHCPWDGSRAVRVRLRRGSAAAPEHSRLLVAQDSRGSREPRGEAARSQALLRLGPDRRRV